MAYVSIGSALGFLAAILPLVLTPGYSFTLATQQALSGRRGGGRVVAAGTSAGIFTHATLAALGLGALVMASSRAFHVVQLVGAAYLLGLGLWALLHRSKDPAVEPPATIRSTRGLLLSAYLGNVLNVKAAGIYLTVAPLFAGRSDPLLCAMLALAAVHATVQTIWLLTWCQLLARGTRHRVSARAIGRVQRLLGVVLVVLGVRQGASALRV